MITLNYIKIYTFIFIFIIDFTYARDGVRTHQRDKERGNNNNNNNNNRKKREGGSSNILRSDIDPTIKNTMADSIYWISHNNAGLFSQFLQLKIMYKKVKELNKKLVVIPVRSKHFGNQKMDLCDLFKLPDDISCVSRTPEGMDCTEEWNDILRKKTKMCYGGKISFKQDTVENRKYILQAVNYELPLVFSSKYSLIINKFVHKLPTSLDNYTVVHWRRGDQLNSRCKQGIDNSVNCGSAKELMAKVKKLSGSSRVFIATNEKASSRESLSLSLSGVDLFNTVDDLDKYDSFEILLIETFLMLHCRTFFGWGVSEINDVIENERMRHNKSFCLAQDPPTSNKQDTWCSKYRFNKDKENKEKEKDSRRLDLADESKKNKVYWVSNNAGLASQFLQMKFLYEKLKGLNRMLVLTPITQTKHYGDKSLILCDIFQFPSDIVCDSLPSGLDCTSTWSKVTSDSTSPSLCYDGTIKMSGNPNEKARKYIIEAVNFNLPLVFQAKFNPLIKEFEKILGVTDDNSFTVVHWRRGDQLRTRCKTGADKSVNCQSATRLIAKVREQSTDKIVFVATNEPKDSPEHEVLRNAGFLTVHDLMRKNTELSAMNIFQILVSEIAIMIRATTFLAWGISEIDDVVEKERKSKGRSFCVTKNDRTTIGEETWCTLYSRADGVSKVNLDFLDKKDIKGANKEVKDRDGKDKDDKDKDKGDKDIKEKDDKPKEDKAKYDNSKDDKAKEVVPVQTKVEEPTSTVLDRISADKEERKRNKRAGKLKNKDKNRDQLN